MDEIPVKQGFLCMSLNVNRGAVLNTGDLTQH